MIAEPSPAQELAGVFAHLSGILLSSADAFSERGNVQTVDADTLRQLVSESHRECRSLRDVAQSIVGSSTDE